MVLRARLDDAVAGLRHLPSRGGWLRVGFEVGWSLPLMLVIAHLGGLIRFEAPSNAITLLMLGATLFVAPALGEELLFRGLLLPRDKPGRAWILCSVALFLLWHPLQAVTIGPPWADAFLDPYFLAVVAILGAALARMYAATGSLWPGVAVHWVVVLGWKALLGGPF